MDYIPSEEMGRYHPFSLLFYPAHVFVVVGDCGGRKCTIPSAELESLTISSGV